jgi:hypothetical protein
MQFSKTTFGKRSGTTLAGMCGTAVVSVLLLCGAGNTPGGNIQTSDLNANGHAITNAANVATTNLNVFTQAALPANTTVGGTNFAAATAAVFPVSGMWGTDFRQGATLDGGGERGSLWYSINGTTSQAIEVHGFENYAPAGGVRDPSIQEVGTNYLVVYTIGSGTDNYDMGVATTSDLVNFTHVTDVAPTSPHTKICAPKWFTDPATGNRYIIGFGNSGELFFLQSTNTAGSTWGAPSANFTFNGGTQINGNDATLVWDATASLWRLYFLDEADTTLGWAAYHMATNTSLSASGWTDTGRIHNIPTGYYLEGASVVQRADGTWIMRCGTAYSAFGDNGAAYSTSTDGVTWNAFQEWPQPPSTGGVNGNYDNGSTLNVADGQTQALLLRAMANQQAAQQFVNGITVNTSPFNITYPSVYAGTDPTSLLNTISLSGKAANRQATIGFFGGDSTGDLYLKAASTGTVTGDIVFQNPSTLATMGKMSGSTGALAWNGNIAATGTSTLITLTNPSTSESATLDMSHMYYLTLQVLGGNYIQFDSGGGVDATNLVATFGDRSGLSHDALGLSQNALIQWTSSSDGVGGTVDTGLSRDPSNPGQVDFGTSSTVGDKMGTMAAAGLTLGGGTKITLVKIITGTLASGAATVSDAAITSSSAIIPVHLGSSTTHAGNLKGWPTGAGTGSVTSDNASDNDTFTAIVVNH